MVFDRRLSRSIALRLLTISAALVAIAWVSREPWRYAATLVVLSVVVIVCYLDILRCVRNTNEQLARLLDGLRFPDYASAVAPSYADQGFPELASAMQRSLDAVQRRVAHNAVTAQHRADLVEQVPIALLLIDEANKVERLNRAARQMFARAQGVELNSYAIFGARFVADLARFADETTTELTAPDDAPQSMRMSQTQLSRAGSRLRLVALQPIQRELDRAEQIIARDILRVLTHEVMNSLTPVTSLAQSASQLAAALPRTQESAEVHAAIETVARRAQGLMAFVARYREVVRIESLRLEGFAIEPLLRECEQLIRAEWPAHSTQLSIEVQAPAMTIEADRHLLAQVLLNLVRNAAQACVGYTAKPRIAMSARYSFAGRPLIEIADNGPGIPMERRREVFLPFYTTKPEGSGVGLSFARQIVLAHGGSIRIGEAALGGASVRIVL
jgi:two-component system, NtrC family, nitrogen regulation sensor histidine kinase NtrY